MKTEQVIRIVFQAVTVALLAAIAIGIFQPRTTDAAQDSIFGTYAIVFYSEDDSEAAQRVAARYNQQDRRLVLMPGGNYFLFQGRSVENGKWSLNGEQLKVGDAEYEVTSIPGGMVMEGDSYLLIAAWRH